ncbi:MAG: hypothetical protein DHS20C18_04160 [Saprospiraceae bacterium]|nr:MAG: hypothetical protein DHS20C18_04160 [Saprospiraceae bacterium]
MGTLNHTVKILEKEQLTHNVLRFVMERPDGFEFAAGQAIELTLDPPASGIDPAPFTLTGLNTADSLEIMFKVYPTHHGMTLGMSKLNKGNSVQISDAWDSFQYQSEGVFIAGGTGITPFIALIRQLNAKRQLNGNQLIFANKKEEDIFLKTELSSLLGNHFVNILSEEKNVQYYKGRINADFLKDHITNFDQSFYLCGPGNFSIDIKAHLLKLGAKENSIITEY